MTKLDIRKAIHFLFPWMAIDRRTFKPLACPVCGAILVRKLDPDGSGRERNYCGHCGTFH